MPLVPPPPSVSLTVRGGAPVLNYGVFNCSKRVCYSQKLSGLGCRMLMLDKKYTNKSTLILMNK